MERQAVIDNSVGQGTNGAVDGCAMMMARLIEQNFQNNEHKITIGDVNIGPTGFIDDVANMRDSAEGLVDAGKNLTAAIDELSLRAHPSKTVNIVLGNKKARQTLKAEMAANPMNIQGFEVKTVDKDVYLGMTFHEGGRKDSIDASIENRRARAIMKTQQAKNILKDQRIEAVGWIDAVRSLYQGTIIPTLTYGSIAWVNMNGKQRKRLEDTQKECLYNLLELLPQAKYAAVLLEIGLPRLSHFINQLKLCYITKLMAKKPNSSVVRLLREEERRLPGDGLLGEVKLLCEKYELDWDVTEEYMQPEMIRDKVGFIGMEEVWNESRSSKKIPLHINFSKARKPYFGNPNKMEAKLEFFYQVGELNFKTNRRREAEAKFGGVLCYIKGCSGLDNLGHCLRCPGYKTRPVVHEDGTPGSLGHLLLTLHHERMKNLNAPLIGKAEAEKSFIY